MKKCIFLVMALFAVMSCYDDSALLSRIDALEKAMYQTQIDALEASVESLKGVDAEIKNTIAALEQADDDAKLQIEGLQRMDIELNGKIASLTTLLDTKISGVKDWAELSFATLAQYDALEKSLSELSELVEANHATLATAITTATSDMRTWVEASLKNYATNKDLEDVSVALGADLAALSSRLDALELRVSTIENQITAINGSIASLMTMDKIINETVDKLKATDADAQSQIDVLVRYDESLKSSIDALKELQDKSIKDTQDWVSLSFATVEQYNTLAEALSGLNDLVSAEVANMKESIDENYRSLSTEILNTQYAIETWVTSTLATYTTNDELQALADNLGNELNTLNSKMNVLQRKVRELELLLGELTKEFTILFSEIGVSVVPGSTVLVEYTIRGAKENAIVKTLCGNGWKAKVTALTNETGYIEVTAPTDLLEEEIIVLVYDGDQKTIMRTLNFITGIISASVDVEMLSAEGGSFSVDVSTNMNYEVVIPDEAQNWLSIVETRAIRTETLTFNCAANPGFRRSATVYLVPEFGEELKAMFSVIQEGSTTDIQDLSSSGTANSYIIPKSGYYKFRTVKGNSNESVGTVAFAELLWESFGTDVVPNRGDLIDELYYEDDYIAFSVAPDYKEGNAVIAAKDAGGNVLWSWHIWLTDLPEDQVYSNGAGTMMDRNLGAVSAVPGDVGALGLLYQWGRKDPFLGSSSISERRRAVSTLEVWPSTASTATEGTVAYATANPTTFILGNDSNDDWCYTADGKADNTRWQSSKTIYDPCPAGYRVPDGGREGVWAVACGKTDYYDDEAYDEVNSGFNFKNSITVNMLADPSATCWYPLVGMLSGDRNELLNLGVSGMFWSCTPAANWIYRFFVAHNPNQTSSVYMLGTNYGRDYALSIRCFKENSSVTQEPAVDLSANGTANSYIVSEAGTYKFPAVQGNSRVSAGAVAAAEVLWESFGTSTAPVSGDLVSDVRLVDNEIIFKASAKKGNAVIAAKDAGGNVLWSWHIWMTDQPQDHVYNNGAGTIMDRNLGAVSAVPGDAGALGLLYQWGRKDPFLGSSSISTSVQAASTGSAEWLTATSESAGTIEYSIANPTTFITYNSYNLDWYYTGDRTTDNTRWQSSKTIYDPCPAGYRIPDGGVDGVWSRAVDVAGDYPAYDSTNKGYDFGGTGDASKFMDGSSCWYPLTGSLNYMTGALSLTGSIGGCLSCDGGEGDYRSYFLYYKNTGDIRLYDNGYHAYGNSVRCMKENSATAPEPVVDLSAGGTANSYIVSEAGTYEIPAFKGNSRTNGGVC